MVASRKAAPIEAAIDLKNPDIYASGDFHGVMARLRAGEPVYWNPEADSTGFWAVTRYDDVVRVMQDPETFSADLRNGGMRIFNKQEVTEEPKPHLLAMDPPRHSELRKALQPAFTGAAATAVEMRVRARMVRLIDAIAAAGKAEFVTSIAAPLTVGLLTDLLDVPEDDAPFLFKWSNAFVGDDDPDYQSTADAREKAIQESDAYAERLLAERRASPGSDVVSLLAAATIDGRPLDFGTYSENFGVMLIAGNETTRHSLSAAVFALSLFPGEKQRLIDDPALIPSAVKEIVRWASPAMHIRRTAMRDVDLGGRHIRKGDKVVVWYNSANRDESKWADSSRLDVGRYAHRSAIPHIAFGSGVHHCLGWRFAELQLRVALEEMLRRIPDFLVVGEPRRVRSNFIGGFKELNIVFTPP